MAWAIAATVALTILVTAGFGWAASRRIRRYTKPARDQMEFADTLQLAETEDEAHHLLQRHLERSVPAAAVTVLNCNNSADRLEPATPVPTGSPLLDSLQHAEPRSCLAVRSGRSPRDRRAAPGAARLPGLRTVSGPISVHPADGGRRGHRIGPAQPGAAVHPGRAATPAGFRRSGRARAGQPAEPGDRRVPGGHRLAHRPAEQAGRDRHPQTDARPGVPDPDPAWPADARPGPLQGDQRPLRAPRRRPGAGQRGRRAPVVPARQRLRRPQRRRGIRASCCPTPTSSAPPSPPRRSVPRSPKSSSPDTTSP